ncbi:MAG: radical SAM protein [Ruthenibacterium sp.]
MTHEILSRARAGALLTKEDACALLSAATNSEAYYAMICAAKAYSRAALDACGIIYAQNGLDAKASPVNCKFCSLAQELRKGIAPEIKTLHDTVREAEELSQSGIEDLFLMTTAEFPQEDFLEYGRAVRAVLPDAMRLVANVGDFDAAYALRLKAAGFTGVYHICRLREGIDTCAAPEMRIRTMDAVRDAGLSLYYCVEPIGPEHTNEELADEMLRMRDYPVDVMAVMKRIAVPGTPLSQNGEISAARLAQICAVTTLVSRPKRAMCVHEPDELCLMAGANQIYAECGCNPRDLEKDTKNGRGFSTAAARTLLQKAEWKER